MSNIFGLEGEIVYLDALTGEEAGVLFHQF